MHWEKGHQIKRTGQPSPMPRAHGQKEAAKTTIGGAITGRCVGEPKYWWVSVGAWTQHVSSLKRRKTVCGGGLPNGFGRRKRVDYIGVVAFLPVYDSRGSSRPVSGFIIYFSIESENRTIRYTKHRERRPIGNVDARREITRPSAGGVVVTWMGAI